MKKQNKHQITIIIKEGSNEMNDSGISIENENISSFMNKLLTFVNMCCRNENYPIVMFEGQKENRTNSYVYNNMKSGFEKVISQKASKRWGRKKQKKSVENEEDNKGEEG